MILLAKQPSPLHPIAADHVLNKYNVSLANLRIGVPALCLELSPASCTEAPHLHLAISPGSPLLDMK